MRLIMTTIFGLNYLRMVIDHWSMTRLVQRQNFEINAGLFVEHNADTSKHVSLPTFLS